MNIFGLSLCLVLSWAQRTHGMAKLFRDPLPTMPSCPIHAVKPDFDQQKFFGDWYAQEMVYSRPMPKLNFLSCIGFHFSTRGFGHVKQNFTFQFPPRVGHMYHRPTSGLVDSANPAIWETKLMRNKRQSSMVLETDYDNWAIMVRCDVQHDGTSKFSNTVILSRTRKVLAEELQLIKTLLSEGMKEMGKFSYTIDQPSSCDGEA